MIESRGRGRGARGGCVSWKNSVNTIALAGWLSYIEEKQRVFDQPRGGQSDKTRFFSTHLMPALHTSFIASIAAGAADGGVPHVEEAYRMIGGRGPRRLDYTASGGSG